MSSRADPTASGDESSSSSRSGGGLWLRPAAFLYGLGARLHRAFMARTAGRRGRVSCAVISVGGLTVGGAGKTPVAARLARVLAHRGHRVVIASRGYRGRTRDRVTVVSDGRHVRSRVEVAGDESLVLAAHAPGVPVLVGRDRRIVAHHAVSLFDARILVLDDGFQHHRIPRDLDIVCLDGREGLGNRRVLPAGPLREPASALAHADWLCLVDPPTVEGVPFVDQATVDRHAASGGKVLRAHRRPTGLVRLDRGEQREVGSLMGLRVGLLAGIARPVSLRATLQALGAEVVSERVFPDHHVYRAADVASLDASVDLWVTTEKDALKILPDWVERGRVFVLEIEALFEDEAALVDEIETRLRAAGRLA